MSNTPRSQHHIRRRQVSAWRKTRRRLMADQRHTLRAADGCRLSFLTGTSVIRVPAVAAGRLLATLVGSVARTRPATIAAQCATECRDPGQSVGKDDGKRRPERGYDGAKKVSGRKTCWPIFFHNFLVWRWLGWIRAIGATGSSSGWPRNLCSRRSYKNHGAGSGVRRVWNPRRYRRSPYCLITGSWNGRSAGSVVGAS